MSLLCAPCLLCGGEVKDVGLTTKEKEIKGHELTDN